LPGEIGYRGEEGHAWDLWAESGENSPHSKASARWLAIDY
jgi:hypothetical protein